MALEEGENVLCTVIKIEKTSVFVKVEDNGEGTIVISEIAPGRIRNLRDYVIQGKRIVCKILRIDKDNIHLSLRRVSEKEKKEVLEKYERERNSLSILRSVLKERAEETAKKIKQKEKSLYEFLQFCKENPEELKKYLSEEESSRICKILQEKKEKKVEVKKDFNLTTNASNGIIKIKGILLPYKEHVIYLAAGKFSLKVISSDYKKANSELNRILQEIEKNAKKENCDFKVKEK